MSSFKSKTKIQTALISLYEQYPFESITVKQLCSRAGVARTTFYNYYQNTVDVIEEIEDQLISDMRERTLAITTDKFENAESLSFIQEYCDYISSHLEVFKAFLVIQPNARFINKWKASTIDHIETRLFHLSPDIHNKELALELTASTVVSGLTYYLKRSDKIENFDIEKLNSYVFSYLNFLETL